MAVGALLAAGCASSDLSKSAETNGEVAECLPTDAPAPSAVVRAIWFPNTSSFGSTDASPLGHATGVLVLAGDKLYFMTWNDPEHHFDMRHVIDFLPALRIGVDRLGTSAMLVIQSGNLSFDSFVLMKGGQFSSDPQVTQELYEKLQALRAKNPQADPQTGPAGNASAGAPGFRSCVNACRVNPRRDETQRAPSCGNSRSCRPGGRARSATC